MAVRSGEEKKLQIIMMLQIDAQQTYITWQMLVNFDIA